MIELDVIKEAVSKFPISGDFITKINENEIIYKSGGRLTTNGQTDLSINDKVLGVHHRYDEKKDELHVGVFHISSTKRKGWFNAILKREKLINIQRVLKIKTIL
ncbi:MAG: hypothetical protein HXX16_03345 [Bacteroidales bacterium]|nr:hypothetical protein [Bacteroidales bacterium]